MIFTGASVRLADKIKHVEDHHLLELIRDTPQAVSSATPLFEPLSVAAGRERIGA